MNLFLNIVPSSTKVGEKKSLPTMSNSYYKTVYFTEQKSAELH